MVLSRNGKKAKMSKGQEWGLGAKERNPDVTLGRNTKEHKGRTLAALKTGGDSQCNGKPQKRGACNLRF